MSFRSFTVLIAAVSLLAPSAFAEKTKVACVGDSITFGLGIAQRDQANYPKYLGDLMGDGFEVRNFGNSGKTCGDYPRLSFNTEV